LYYTLDFSTFLFNDAATTAIYTLSLHDALPISSSKPNTRTVRLPLATSSRRHNRTAAPPSVTRQQSSTCRGQETRGEFRTSSMRSEEHTSELQSRENLVCRLLLEKKKHTKNDRP